MPKRRADFQRGNARTEEREREIAQQGYDNDNKTLTGPACIFSSNNANSERFSQGTLWL